MVKNGIKEVYNQAGTQVGDQVSMPRYSIGDQVENKIFEQVWHQVGYQVGYQTHTQVRLQVGDQHGRSGPGSVRVSGQVAV